MDKGAEHTNPKRVPRRRSTEIESQSEAPNQIGGQGDELEGKPNDRKIRYTTHIYIYIYINIYIYIYTYLFYRKVMVGDLPRLPGIYRFSKLTLSK